MRCWVDCCVSLAALSFASLVLLDHFTDYSFPYLFLFGTLWATAAVMNCNDIEVSLYVDYVETHGSNGFCYWKMWTVEQFVRES